MARLIILLVAALLAAPAQATVYVNRDYYWTGTEWRHDIVDRHYPSGTSTTWGVDTDFDRQGQGTPYVLEADVYVDQGGTLNVEAGVTVKITSARGVYVAGTLNAIGTEESPAVFTALDGAFPGSWDEICVHGAGANGTTFRYCHISFGGSRAYRTKGGFAHYANGNIVAKDCSPSIDHVVSSSSGLAGFYSYGVSNPTITSSTFAYNDYGLAFGDGSYPDPALPPLPIRFNTLTSNNHGAWMTAQSAGALDSSNNVTGNVRNVIRIAGSQVQSSAIWRALQGAPVWELFDDVTVPADKSLTIDPGCVVKFNPAKSLYAGGTLTAQGSPESKIHFTSIADDSVGGDSNGDGSATAPARGDWGEVLFHGAGSNGSRLSDCVLRFGGSGRFVASPGGVHQQNGNLGFWGSAPEVSDTVSADSNHDGANLMSSAKPALDGVSFEGCTDWAVNCAHVDANPVVSDCSATQCGRNAVGIPAGTMTGTRTWHKSLPYVLNGEVGLASTGRLELRSGVVVKAGSGAGLYSAGSLQAIGTAAEPVWFTSLKDDSVGGDANGDGAATSPSPGDWREIFLNGTTGAGTFEHCGFRYGGDGASSLGGGVSHVAKGNVYCHQGGPSFDHCEFSFSANDGVHATGSAAAFSSSTFAKNGQIGIEIAGDSDILADSCLFSTNGEYGVKEHTQEGAALSATYCNVHGLMRYQHDTGSGWEWRTGVPPGTGNLAGDPQFLNAASGDFGIKPPSPCINAGDPGKTDPNGSRLDIGTYPYDGPWNPIGVTAARALPNGTEVLLAGRTATAGATELGDRIYVEEENRATGLAIISNAASQSGDRIYVTGKLATVQGERAITNATVSAVIPANAVPGALFTANKGVGGASAGDNIPGIPGASGAYNLGLLIKIAGKVSAVGTGCFWVDDGSRIPAESGNLGIKVLSGVAPSVDQSVTVVGISGAYDDAGTIRGVIRARTTDDVTISP